MRFFRKKIGVQLLADFEKYNFFFSIKEFEKIPGLILSRKTPVEDYLEALDIRSAGKTAATISLNKYYILKQKTGNVYFLEFNDESAFFFLFKEENRLYKASLIFLNEDVANNFIKILNDKLLLENIGFQEPILKGFPIKFLESRVKEVA